MSLSVCCRLCSGETPTSASPSALDEGVQVLVSFVSYQIHTNVTEEILSQLFAPYGQVIDCVVKSHVSHFLGANQKQGGYGFVAFATKESAQSVVGQGTINFTFGEVQIHCDCKLSKATATRLGMSMPSPTKAADADATKTASPRDSDDSDDHVSVLTMSTVAEEGEASASPSAATWSHSAAKSPPSHAKATLSDSQTRPVSFSSGYSNESAATFGASPSMQSPIHSRASTSPMAQYPQMRPSAAVSPSQGQYFPAVHHVPQSHGQTPAQGPSPPLYVRVDYQSAPTAAHPPTATFAPPSFALAPYPPAQFASPAPPGPYAMPTPHHQPPLRHQPPLQYQPQPQPQPQYQPPSQPFAYHQSAAPAPLPLPMQVSMPMQMPPPGYGPAPAPMRSGYAPQSQSPPGFQASPPAAQQTFLPPPPSMSMSMAHAGQPYAVHMLPHGFVPSPAMLAPQEVPLESPRGPFVHVVSAPPLPYAYPR